MLAVEIGGPKSTEWTTRWKLGSMSLPQHIDEKTGPVTSALIILKGMQNFQKLVVCFRISNQSPNSARTGGSCIGSYAINHDTPVVTPKYHLSSLLDTHSHINWWSHGIDPPSHIKQKPSGFSTIVSCMIHGHHLKYV